MWCIIIYIFKHTHTSTTANRGIDHLAQIYGKTHKNTHNDTYTKKNPERN